MSFEVVVGFVVKTFAVTINVPSIEFKKLGSLENIYVSIAWELVIVNERKTSRKC